MMVASIVSVAMIRVYFQGLVVDAGELESFATAIPWVWQP